VVGHQDIAVNCATVIGSRLAKPIAIARIILIGKEGRRAIVAALDQVQRRRSGRADAAPCNGWLDRPVDARGDERAGNCRSAGCLSTHPSNALLDDVRRALARRSNHVLVAPPGWCRPCQTFYRRYFRLSLAHSQACNGVINWKGQPRTSLT